MRQLQRAISLIYPDHCALCETRVEHQGGLCGACWRETPFLDGLVCYTCGTSLPGEDAGIAFCDECMAMPRQWHMGRAALSYRDAGRRIVLALKHADRLDLVPACAGWMHRAGRSMLSEDTLLVPVPAHWTRLLTRRYNQAAELCRALARGSGLPALPDALIRTERTRKLDGLTVSERFETVPGTIKPNAKHLDRIQGRSICLIDDVMTSGATLTASTAALFAGGAEQVCVLALARVEKTP